MRFKISLIILLIIMSFGLSAGTFAATANDIERVLKNEKIDSAREVQEVKDIISNCQARETFFNNKDKFKSEDLKNVNSAGELVYGEPYKVIISDKELLDGISNAERVSELIKKMPYYWEVPVLLRNNPDKAIGTFTIDNYNGKWQVAEIGGYLPQEEVVFSSKTERIEAAINENSIKSPQSIVHIRIPSINTDYIYVDANDQEYYIELEKKKTDGSAKVTQKFNEGRKIKKTPKEVSDKIKNIRKLSSGKLSGGVSTETYQPDRDFQNNNLWRIPLLAILSAAVIAVLAVKHKKKRICKESI